MIEVNWKQSQTESVTAIYMSNWSGSWKQPLWHKYTTTLFIPCSSYTVFTHVQKEFNSTKSKGGESLKKTQTQETTQTWRDTRVFFLLPTLSSRQGYERKSRKWLTIILCSELGGYGWPSLSPNHDAREQKTTNATFFERSNIVPSSGNVLQYWQGF